MKTISQENEGEHEVAANIVRDIENWVTLIDWSNVVKSDMIV